MSNRTSCRTSVWTAVIGLLACHTGLLAYGAWVHSPTFNEPGHLVAGISNWRLGRFELFNVNPPLVRMVAALPVLAVGCETDWTKFHTLPGGRAEGAIGEDFVAANGRRSIWLFRLARCACIPFSIIGALFCFLWTRDLFNQPRAGLVALCLWCFEPNIIAHGHLITTDCAATALGLGAAYLFWRWLKAPSWQNALSAGVLLGFAELAKMTWIVLFILWPLLWVFYRTASCETGKSAHRWSIECSQLGVLLALALYIVNAGYAFDGTFTKLKNLAFVSTSLSGLQRSGEPGNRFADQWFGELPIPVPKQYLLGLDAQKHDFEALHSPSYLRGEWKDRGWWYYYLYALFVKTPHGTQCLLLLAAGALAVRTTGNPKCRDLVVLLAPAVVVVVIVSAQTEINHHLRYVLPIFGFIFVLIGKCARYLCSRRLAIRMAIYALLAWTLLSSLRAQPHSLSYFNELAGGLEKGHKHLLHSNIDWGQDLLLLEKWLKANPGARPFHLAYFGHFEPSSIDLDYPMPPDSPSSQACVPSKGLGSEGWYGISANYVCGARYRDSSRNWSWFEHLEPEECVGGSLLIYHIEERP